MDVYRVILTFTEPLLGTVPLDSEIYETYILSRGGNDDEMVSLPEQIERGTTGFHQVAGKPVLYDYQLKGFLKDACSMLRRDRNSQSAKLTAFKKVIDGLVFVKPRRVPINIVGETTHLQRPLRAQTAQGERIALARSVAVPAGSSIAFDVLVLSGVDESLLREWFDYGAWRGLGQWRNGGYGSFTNELAKA